jgi:hypothetical protein
MFEHTIVEGAVILKAAVDMIKAVRSLTPPAKPDLLPVYRLKLAESPSDHQASADVPDTLDDGGLGCGRARLGLLVGAGDGSRGTRGVPHDLMFHN